MRTQFNLIPPDGAEYENFRGKNFSVFGAFILIAFCAAEFAVCSSVKLSGLQADAQKFANERKEALTQTEILNGQAKELLERQSFWQRLLDEAQNSAPVLESEMTLLQALPETASLQSFFIDAERLRLDVIFADRSSLEPFIRKMTLPQYGALHVLERRVELDGGLYCRFEGTRRK